MFLQKWSEENCHNNFLEKSAEFTKEILEAKKNCILKMTKKVADSNVAPKSYWTVLNCLPYIKKLPTMPPLLMVSLFQTFVKKQTCLIIFLLLYAHLWIMQPVYCLFHKEQAAGLNPLMLLKVVLNGQTSEW